MRPSEVDAFLAEFEGSGVAVGLEVDHLDGHEDETRAIVADVVDRARQKGLAIGGFTGSVHFLPGKVADLDRSIDKGEVKHFLCDYLPSIMEAHLAEHGAAATVTDYFGGVRRMIATGFFDVVGHLELRIGAGGNGARMARALRRGRGLYAEGARRDPRARGGGRRHRRVQHLEGPTSRGRPAVSLRRRGARLRPARRAKNRALERHPLAEHVARHFDLAIATLRRLGVDTLWAVRDRERIAVRL